MKHSLTKVVVGAAALALASGTLGVLAASSASATTPPFEPDPNSIGALTFYNASGTQITGGSTTDAPFAAYVLASSPGRSGDTKATLFGALPVSGVPTGSWSSEALTGSRAYPNAAAPGALGTTALPVVSLTSGDETIAQLASDLPQTGTGAYSGLYQLRVKTSGPGQGVGGTYDSADIQITGSTWQVVYAPTTATATSLNVTPASSSGTSTPVAGTPVTLTASVTPVDSTVSGTVQFYDGVTALGSPVALSSGSASYTTSALAKGTHSLTAVFTPSTASAAVYAASTSSATSYVVYPGPVVGTTTALSVNPTTAAAFTAVSLQADVANASTTDPVGAVGSVEFFDGATQIGSVAVNGSGAATLSYSNFATGTHALTAQFVPTDPTSYATSTSAAVSFTATAPTSVPASQTVDVSVPAGSLTITTPYSPSNPFNLGSTVLASNGTQISASAAFGSATNPTQGVTITDTRAGDQGWTASATATDFTNGGSAVINGQNLTLTGVTPEYIAGNALQAGSVTTSDITNAAIYGASATGSDGLKGAGHVFATAPSGDSVGSVNVVGNLNLVAPTSTEAGSYTATLTFTIA